MLSVIGRLRSMGRQRIVGWLLIIVATLHVIYFIRGRLLEAGDPIRFMEWLAFAVSLGMVMLGTMNIRLADMRERVEAQAHQQAEEQRRVRRDHKKKRP